MATISKRPYSGESDPLNTAPFAKRPKTNNSYSTLGLPLPEFPLPPLFSTHDKVSITPHVPPPPKLWTPTSAHTAGAENVLSCIALTDLKSCVQGLLSNPLAGPLLCAELQKLSEKSLRHIRMQAKKQHISISAGMSRSREKVERRGHRNKGYLDCSDFGDAMKPWLGPCYHLWKLGPMTEGPKLAFDLLMEMIGHSIEDLDGSEFRLYDEEDSNDELHSNIDAVLVAMLKEEANGTSGPNWNKSDENIKKLKGLEEFRDRMLSLESGVLMYRYKWAIQMLTTGKIDSGGPTIPNPATFSKSIPYVGESSDDSDY